MWGWSTRGRWSIMHRARLTMAPLVWRRKLPVVWRKPKRQKPFNMRVIDRCNSMGDLVLPGSAIRRCSSDAPPGANSSSATQCIIGSVWHPYFWTSELFTFGLLVILTTALELACRLGASFYRRLIVIQLKLPVFRCCDSVAGRFLRDTAPYCRP